MENYPESWKEEKIVTSCFQSQGRLKISSFLITCPRWVGGVGNVYYNMC